MKHCNKCNVDVVDSLENCPLCGSFVAGNENTTTNLAVLDEANRPKIQFKNKKNFWQNKVNRIMILSVIVCVVLNLLLTPKSNWSVYVAVGSLFLIFVIIMPLAEKTKLQTQIKIDLFILTICAVILELAITNLHFEWFVIKSVLPWVYVGGVVLVNFLILFRRYTDKGLFTTLVYTTFFAIAPQIVLWIAEAVGANIEIPLSVFVIFFASIFNCAIVLIVCTRSLKEEIERNYNL